MPRLPAELLSELLLLTEMRNYETIEAESRRIVLEIRESGYTTPNDRLLANCIRLCPPLCVVSSFCHNRLFSPISFSPFLFYSFVFPSHVKPTELHIPIIV